MMGNTATQVRCHTCGTWNELHSEADLCKSCHDPLRKVSEHEEQNREMRRRSWEIDVIIYPEDSLLMRMGKKIFNAVQMVFMAIVAFFIWLFFIGPG